MLNPQFYNPRPRHFNPTYASNNINYSMRNYLGFSYDLQYKQPVAYNSSQKLQTPLMNSKIQQSKRQGVESINPKNNYQGFQQYRSQSLRALPNNFQRGPQANQRPAQKVDKFIPLIERRLVRKPSQEDLFKSSTTNLAFSNLSKVGSNSLKNLTAADQVKVYEKQQKKYNIITGYQKKYLDTIKIHPKYHLETQDQYHRRRKSLIQGKVEDYDKFNKQIQKKSQPGFTQSTVIRKIPEINSIQKKPLFRPKALNNADDMQGLL